MKKIIVAFFLSIICLVSFSQSDTAITNKPLGEELKKNSIYGTASTIVFYHTATVNYERMLKHNMWNRNISSFMRYGAGYSVEWTFDFKNDGIPFIFSHYGLLFGKKSHHLETSAGIMVGYIDSPYDLKGPYILPLPSFIVGYRFQKPGGNFMFRSGLSFPEGAYIGLGYSF